MSIFGSIASAIFGSAVHAEGYPATPAASSAPDTPATPIVAAANDKGPAPAASAPAPSAPAANAPPAPDSPNIVAKTPVDVMAVLDKLDDANDEKLDWSTSIVDLMKLLKLESSLTARKTLAKELGYTGDTKDSAKMNVWLHKAVMTKLAENGGIVPKELQH